MITMTPKQKMDLTMLIFNLIFNSKQNGVDITTVRISHPNIVNGKPILQNNVRVGGEINGRWFENSATHQKTLRGFDVDLQIDNGILQLRFIEQNPDKVDVAGNLKPMAIAARRGSHIMWLIDRTVHGGDGFLGRIQDGQFYQSHPRAVAPATQPVRNTVATSVQSASQETANEEFALYTDPGELPEVIEEDLPDWLIEQLSEQADGPETEFGEIDG